MRPTFAAGAIVLLIACGQDMTTPITPAPPPIPENSFALSGWVYDTAYRPVDQAKVEALNGPQAGAVTMSDARGQFSFGAQRFTEGVTLQASKEGHMTSLQRITPDGRNFISFTFSLAASTPAVDLTGNYVIALAADTACAALPPNATSRTYTATISRGFYETSYVGRLSGATFVEPGRFGRYDSFYANVFGSFVRISFFSDDEINGIVEQLNPDTYLGITGEATAIAENFPFDASFAGGFEYCPGPRASASVLACTVTPISCTSTNHRLTLVRQ